MKDVDMRKQIHCMNSRDHSTTLKSIKVNITFKFSKQSVVQNC